MASDEELASDFIARKPAAFEQAYESHARVLHAVARSVLGERFAAEDCVHDALLRVWQTPGSYRRERGSLRNFLIACIRTEALMTLRGESRRSAREERSARLDRAAEAPENQLVDFLEARRVRDALRRLPSEQRAAIELVYYGHRSQAQAATQLGVPLGTLKSRCSLGIRRLGVLLAETAR